MAKAKKKTAPKVEKEAKKEKGKQLDLIDVTPKQVKPILAEAREYIKYRDSRMAVQKKEVEHKQRIIELVQAAKLQPLKEGVIRFACDGVEITLTPEGIKLKVKET